MGAVPQHLFFLRVLESLQRYDRKCVLPYITIMYSTGPLFLSVVWKVWVGENSGRLGDWEGRVRVLGPKSLVCHHQQKFLCVCCPLLS